MREEKLKALIKNYGGSTQEKKTTAFKREQAQEPEKQEEGLQPVIKASLTTRGIF